MKKNRMMRLASGLLVAVLLTTSMIAGTFAKYTTQDSAYDSARVAKWGVEVQAVGNLYGDTYASVDDGNVIVKEDATGFTVQSNNKLDDVVAPGTLNDEGMTFSLKGQPEVAGEVITEMKVQNVFLEKGIYGVMIPIEDGVVTEENFDEFTQPRYTTAKVFEDKVGLYYKDGNSFKFTKNWIADAKYYTLEDHVKLTAAYYPVEYTLAGNTNYTEAGAGEGKDTLKNIADLIAAQLGIAIDEEKTNAEVNEDNKQNTTKVYYGTKEFTPNTDLASWMVDDLTLTWKWDWAQVDADKGKTGDEAQMHDKADTILGMLENTTDGTVVKLDTNSTSQMISDDSFNELVEYTDYCLDTQFSIDITVTQVD